MCCTLYPCNYSVTTNLSLKKKTERERRNQRKWYFFIWLHFCRKKSRPISQTQLYVAPGLLFPTFSLVKVSTRLAAFRNGFHLPHSSHFQAHWNLHNTRPSLCLQEVLEELLDQNSLSSPGLLIQLLYQAINTILNQDFKIFKTSNSYLLFSLNFFLKHLEFYLFQKVTMYALALVLQTLIPNLHLFLNSNIHVFVPSSVPHEWQSTLILVAIRTPICYLLWNNLGLVFVLSNWIVSLHLLPNLPRHIYRQS